jgi:hypothetical protein
MVMLQLAPEIEVKMEIDLDGVDTTSRDALHAQKEAVFAEFKRRMEQAFPEGFRLHTLEFGPDKGWHDELRGKKGDAPVIT